MIRLNSITKRFGATVAMCAVSAEFHSGEIHCILGENGAGKSTLGKIVGGLLRPGEGTIEIDGQVQSLANPRAAHELGVAMCYQELSLARHLSVRANLCLGSETVKQPFTRVDKVRECFESQAVLRKLGLELDMEQPVGDLPVAQQQLIEIGKALMLKPRAVIFDEPTAMLGATEKLKFLAVLRQLRAEGVASVLITHHIEDVMAVSDRVTIMRNGKVIDSFLMGPQITEDDVVERLTGKKREQIRTKTLSKKVHGNPLLRIDNLRWRNQTARSISIHQGQIVSLYGVVGCGAEKIVAALAGQGKADPLQFQLRLRGYRPSSAAQAQESGVAYLPAGRAANCILPTRSITENLTLGNLRNHARFGLIARASEQRYAHNALCEAGVRFTDSALLITSLSGGNQQKVFLARAMAAARDLILLEEPTAGVDIHAKAQIHARIRAAAERGLTVVLMSSDLDETVALSDVVYTLYRSEIAGCYEAPDIVDQPSIIADVLGQRSELEHQPSMPAAT